MKESLCDEVDLDSVVNKCTKLKISFLKGLELGLTSSGDVDCFMSDRGVGSSNKNKG